MAKELGVTDPHPTELAQARDEAGRFASGGHEPADPRGVGTAMSGSSSMNALIRRAADAATCPGSSLTRRPRWATSASAEALPAPRRARAPSRSGSNAELRGAMLAVRGRIRAADLW
jgi:hypothetical protein